MDYAECIIEFISTAYRTCVENVFAMDLTKRIIEFIPKDNTTNVISDININVSIILFGFFFLFVYSCIFERDDIKTLFKKLKQGVVVVWKNTIDPVNLVGYIIVAILLSNYSRLLKEISEHIEDQFSKASPHII